MKHVQLKSVSLKRHATVNEAWVQQELADDPSLLGLGEVVVRDRERKQPRAGRLDLLLQDPETGRRYEVELQLGETDESHIIRAIEYWDLERKRYPQYEHCCVIVAERINGRFLNVISLFNGFVPLIAIQMTAYEIDGGIALTFTKVVDEMPLGPVEEDEVEEPADRAYWEERATKATLTLVDKMLAKLAEIAPGIQPKYNKHYIGLAQNGVVNNFVTFRPRKKLVHVAARLPKSDEMTHRLEEAQIETWEYTKWGRYRVRVTPEDYGATEGLLVELMQEAAEKSL